MKTFLASQKGWRFRNTPVQVSDEDSDLINIRWSINKIKTKIYAFHYANKKDHEFFGVNPMDVVYLHRFILSRKLGIPYNQMKNDTDHVDCNGLNCQRYNLRVATRSQNCCNRKTTKWKGTWKTRYNTFSCSIDLHGQTYYLGTFKTQKEAKAKRDLFAVILHGAFASV